MRRCLKFLIRDREANLSMASKKGLGVQQGSKKSVRKVDGATNGKSNKSSSKKPAVRLRNTKEQHQQHSQKQQNPGEGGGLLKVEVDDTLGAIVGRGSRTRPEIVRGLWEYVREHRLQDTRDGRFIVPDRKFSRVMGAEGRRINAFRMAKFINTHIKK